MGGEDAGAPEIRGGLDRSDEPQPVDSPDVNNPAFRATTFDQVRGRIATRLAG